MKRLHKRLKTELDSKEDALNSSKADCVLYEKDVSDRIMQINNRIAMLKKELEKNEQEKNKKREEGQAVSNVKLEKVKQISKIMLSIDHLEYFCKYKNLKNKLEKNEKIIMQYDAIKGNDHFKSI